MLGVPLFQNMTSRELLFRLGLIGLAFFCWNVSIAPTSHNASVRSIVSKTNGSSVHTTTNRTVANRKEPKTPSRFRSSTNNAAGSEVLGSDRNSSESTHPPAFPDRMMKPSLQETLASSIPFYPNLALNEYQYYHSAQALADAPHGRKYAIAFWWCPDRAGNILHNLWNTLLWSIITNRTVLWVYEDYWDGSNSFEACSQSLQIAEWLPRWDDFQTQLHLAEPVPIPLDAELWRYDTLHEVVIFPQIPDLQSHNKQIYRNEWRNHPLDLPAYRRYVRQLPEEQQRVAAMLYYYKVDYLLGMLFRECFTVVNPLNLPPDVARASNDSFSVALHSRHPVVGDDGSFVEEEKDCLRQLLAEQTSRTEPSSCVVYLMSDRPTTIQLLSDFVQTLGCLAVSAPHDGTSGKTEHGPWAGVGFLDDLALASHARDAVVGDVARSSFELVAEVVTYDRFIEAFQQGKTEISDLKHCPLQNKGVSYNYGPGTPTFRHHSRMAALEPVSVMLQYQQQHDRTSLHNEQGTTSRRYLIVNYTCNEDSIQRFLQGMLIAVVENCTLLWDTDGSCGTSLVPQEWLPSVREWSLIHNATSVNHELPHWNGTMDDDALDASSSSILVWHALPQSHGGPLPLQSVVSREEALGGLSPKSALYQRAMTLGNDFLLGMFFSYAFSFRSKPLPVIPLANENTASRPVQTMAVDARRWSKMDPSAMQCLASAIDPTLTCQVLVLSNHTPDSATVYQEMEVWLSSRNCTIAATKRAYAVNDADAADAAATRRQPSRQDWYFWSDVALASNARYGYVGPDQQSLVLQLIEYRRQVEMWKLGRDPPLLPRNLTRCVV